ncbi:MAG: hypothetical protein OXJ90_02730 [Spirochaetaceae bacterium]|nr:hypothetical protein [Spirochaetaceae bacterium]
MLMVNEGHDDLRRCTRTRDIGVRMIAPAHAAGVRHLAMEALTPDFAAAANRELRLGPGSGYLAQFDLRALMMTALEHGWSLNAYEIDVERIGPGRVPSLNERDEQQALNLAAAFSGIAKHSKMMVWCGWTHHFKRSIRSHQGAYEPMGLRFLRATGITPFCIDQTVTIRLQAPDRESPIARHHRRVLERFGGTAGYLLRRTGLPPTPVRWFYRGVDAVICSLHNRLE